MRAALLISVVAAVAALLAGCGLLSGIRSLPAGSPTAIVGLRTDPDGRGLLAGYTGGACDGPARLDVHEAANRVTVQVRVSPGAGGPGAACIAIGIGRNVHADLSAPLGRREVFEGNRVLVPFDGARLLQPRALPSGFVVVRDSGGADESGRTTTWTLAFGLPLPAGRFVPCRRDPGSFEVSVGGAPGYEPPSYFRRTGTIAVPGGTGRLFEQPPAARYLMFERAGTAVSITSSQSCGREQLLSPQQLAAIARSLVPL